MKPAMRRTETSHFYLGRVVDEACFCAFLEEDYERQDGEPRSDFYGSQGELFCDHDVMETGTRQPGQSLEAFFAPHSYADRWKDAVCQAARALRLEDANVLLFIHKDEIAAPRSVQGKGFELIYVGAFSYPI